MGPAEILHRGSEQARRYRDSRRNFAWGDFGKFHGPLLGLPGRSTEPPPGVLADAIAVAAQIGARKPCLLNREWPHTITWNDIWHLDPVTGSHWPGADSFAFDADYRHIRGKGDVKYVWELNRLQFLPALALAKEHELLAAIVESWMTCNPPFRGINWVSGIEAASRVVSLLAALALLDRGKAARLEAQARTFLDAHIFWIARYPSLYSSSNNHRVAELVAQLLFALCAPEANGAKARLQASRAQLEDRMHALFHADGVGAEQSPTYGAYALEWFALAGLALKGSSDDFSTAFKARAAKAGEYLLWLMDDTGRVPDIGDNDATRVLAIRQEPEPRYAASIVALLARWLDVPALCPPGRDRALRDMWGGTGADMQTAAAISGTQVLPQGGATIVRHATTHGTLVLVFDHGPLGFEAIAAHGHADALGVWLSWGDEPVLIDAGTYLYHSGEELRDRFRSTHMHNTLSLDGRNQSQIAGAFNWSRHATVRLVEHAQSTVTAEHDGYLRSHGVRHRRTVRFGPGTKITIEDRLIGKLRREAKWEFGFVLAPEIETRCEGDRLLLTTPKGRVVSIASRTGDWRIQATDYSPSFGVLRATKRLTLTGICDAGLVACVEVEACGTHEPHGRT